MRLWRRRREAGERPSRGCDIESPKAFQKFKFDSVCSRRYMISMKLTHVCGIRKRGGYSFPFSYIFFLPPTFSEKHSRSTTAELRDPFFCASCSAFIPFAPGKLKACRLPLLPSSNETTFLPSPFLRISGDLLAFRCAEKAHNRTWSRMNASFVALALPPLFHTTWSFLGIFFPFFSLLHLSFSRLVVYLRRNITNFPRDGEKKREKGTDVWRRRKEGKRNSPMMKRVLWKPGSFSLHNISLVYGSFQPLLFFHLQEREDRIPNLLRSSPPSLSVCIMGGRRRRRRRTEEEEDKASPPSSSL